MREFWKYWDRQIERGLKIDMKMVREKEIDRESITERLENLERLIDIDKSTVRERDENTETERGGGDRERWREKKREGRVMKIDR